MTFGYHVLRHRPSLCVGHCIRPELGIEHVLAQHVGTVVIHLADEWIGAIEVRQVRVEPGLIVPDLRGQQVAGVLVLGL